MNSAQQSGTAAQGIMKGKESMESKPNLQGQSTSQMEKGGEQQQKGSTTTDRSGDKGKGEIPVQKRTSSTSSMGGNVMDTSFLPSLLPSLNQDPFLGFFQHDVPFLFPSTFFPSTMALSTGPSSSSSMNLLENRPNTMMNDYIAIEENHRLPVTLINTPTEYILRADVPGVDQSHLAVEIGDKNDLHIIVHRVRHKHEENEAREHGQHFLSTERPRGGVQRQIKFPMNVNLDQCKISLCCGLLTIKVPKMQDTSSSSRMDSGSTGTSTMNMPSAPGRKVVTIG